MGIITSIPRTVDIGQNLKVTVRPVKMGDYTIGLAYGIGYLVQEDVIIKRYAWKKYSTSIQTNQNTTLSIPITKDMYDRQAKQQSIFFYIQDSGSRKIVIGAGGCRTSGFNVTVPGITPPPGTLRVARRIVGGTVFVDQYESGGLLTYAHYDWGSTIENVFHVFFRRDIRYMRLSLFCSRSISEQAWLLNAGVTIVPDDWQASDGIVSLNLDPACAINAKFMQIPAQIPETWRTWEEFRSEQTIGERFSMVVPPDVLSALPLDLVIDIHTCETVCGPVQIKTWEDVWREQEGLEDRTDKWTYTAPVTFSVNNIDICTVNPVKHPYPLPGMARSNVVIDLLDSQSLWSHILPNVDSVTVKARSPETLLNGMKIPALYAEATVPVWRPGQEPTPITTPTPVTPTPVTPTPVTPTPTPVTPTPSDKRRPVTCRDGSVIYQEIYVDGAWIPSGETCPEDIAKRTMMAAVPKIMYEGQAVDIVVGAYIGAAPSTDETATLTIDDTGVSRMNTKAGEVKFRWIAEGVGMHNLCITIPANENSPTPGRVCKTIMVSADVGSIKEQVEAEMDAYSDELELIRRKKQLSRETLRRYVPAGSIVVPATFAGESIDIGGVTRIVPPAGMTIPIDAGRHEVGVIVGGVEKLIDIVVLPGAEVLLQ